MKPRRPKPFSVDRVRVRVHRGPRRDGRWYWRADCSDGHGGRQILWQGWASRAEAGARVLEVMAEPEPGGDSELVTVGDLLECWVASRQGRLDLSPYTLRAARAASVRLLEHGLRWVRLTRLGRRDLELHRDAALGAGLAGGTIQRDLKYLASAWRWGREIGEVPARDLPKVRVHRIDPVRTRYTPTAEEVAKLLAGVSPAVRRGLILLSATGARIGEITSLTWDRVPLDCARLYVSGKTGPRWVTLHPTVAAEMRSWDRGRPEEPVVGVTGQTIRVALVRGSKRIGIPRVSPTGLRRHVVDAMYRAASPEVAGSQLGHSPQTALQHYRRVSEADRRKAVEAAELGVVIALPGCKAAPDSAPTPSGSAPEGWGEYSQGDK